MENKKQLIDVNEFRKLFWLKLQDLRFIGPMDVEHIILNTPTVDAVEVVRCKDCKHYWKNVNTPGFDGKCTMVGDDDFCSDGERKDNERKSD